MLLAALLASACGSRTGLFAPEAKNDCAFPDAAKLLELVNDTTLTAADYVSRCNLTTAQASALVEGRRYARAEQVSLPGMDTSTCDRLIQCAATHTPPVCTPNNHPDVVLELLVDESGSMIGDKWMALRASLLALFEDIAADNDAALRVGVIMFDDVATTKVAPAPLTQAGQLARLRSVVDKSDPHGGGTGTKRALDSAFGVVDQISGVRRVVVLLSDGSPTGGDEEKAECLDLTRNENATHGTQLFSVGIGPFPSMTPSTYDPAFMGRLAVSGGTGPKGCSPESVDESKICHYQVTPGGDPARLQQSFGAALDAIRQSATTCP